MMDVVLQERYTVEDLEALLESGENYELLNGELIGMSPTKFTHGVITAEITRVITAFVYEHKLGLCTGAEMGIKFSDENLIAPDLGFVASERLTKRSINNKGWLVTPPDLVVEVASKSNTPANLDDKMAVYFQYGVKQVWIIYPNRRKVMVYRSESDIQVLLRDDVLSGSDILPGFEVRVRSLFTGLDFLEI